LQVHSFKLDKLEKVVLAADGSEQRGPASLADLQAALQALGLAAAPQAAGAPPTHQLPQPGGLPVGCAAHCTAAQHAGACAEQHPERDSLRFVLSTDIASLLCLLAGAGILLADVLSAALGGLTLGAEEHEAR
jgi:hypothetical protein